MTEEVKGLPVSGYKPTQPPEAIAAVNEFKILEEMTLRQIEKVFADWGNDGISVDTAWLARGRNGLQAAFMCINRAIFQPGRISLPGDPPPPSKDDMPF